MRRPLLLTAWLLTDLVLFVGAYACAYFLRVGFIVSTDFPLDHYLQAVLIVAPVWIGTMLIAGVFRLTSIQASKRNLLVILGSCIVGLSLFTLAYYFVFNQFFSRLLLVYAGALSVVFTVIWHVAFDQWQRRVLRKDPPAFPVLVIGANRDAECFIKLLNERQSPLKPVAVLDPAGTAHKEIAGVAVLGKLDRLEETIKNLRPAYLVQCSNLEHTLNLISVCRNHKMTYMLLPSVLGVVGGSERSMSIEGQPVTIVEP